MGKLIAVILALLLPGAGLAAQPAEAGEAQVVEGQAELEGAGKVIEIDSTGTAKVVKGEGATAAPPPAKAEPLKKGEVLLAEACKLRYGAQCEAMRRCQPAGEEPLDCAVLVAGCEGLPGKAPYPRKVVDDCAKGLKALKCQPPAAEGAVEMPEARVAACKPILDAENEPAPAVEEPPPAGEGELPGGEPDLRKFKTIEVPQDPSAP